MKRFFSFVFSVVVFVSVISTAFAQDVNSLDLHQYSFEELAALRESAMREMMARYEWQEVVVPAGTYQVGKHIPAGHWVITSPARNYCYVTIGYSLKDNGKEIPYGCSGYYHTTLCGADSGVADRGYSSFIDLDLKEGMYIYIERSYVTFTPYTGDHGFKFK